MAIYVAAIAKNESEHIAEWFESVKEADGIYVLDTGSTDDTIPKLLELEYLNPNLNVACVPLNDMDYAAARQLSFYMCPQTAGDIIMWIDIDERWQPGWSKIMAAQDPSVDGFYVDMDFLGDGSFVYQQLKGCRVGAYVWQYAIHEVLSPVIQANTVSVSGFNTIHKQTPNKGYRKDHLRMLQRENALRPNDQRVLFYLIRQHCYAFTDMVADSSIHNKELVSYFKRYMAHPIEHLASTRNPYAVHAFLAVAKAIQRVGELAQAAIDYSYRAIALHPDCIEPHAQLAISSYYVRDNLTCISSSIQCLDRAVQHNLPMFNSSKSYLDELPWYLVKACESVGLNHKAVFYAHKYNLVSLAEHLSQQLVGREVP